MKRILLAASAALLLAGCGDDYNGDPVNDQPAPSKPRVAWKCTSDGAVTACKFMDPGYYGFPLKTAIPPCRPLTHFVTNVTDGTTGSITVYCVRDGV